MKNGYNFHEKMMEFPKTMFRTKKRYEKLGFLFEESNDPTMIYVILPKGWRMEKYKTFWGNIHDEKGRLRGSFFCKDSVFDSKDEICLKRRYQMKVIYDNAADYWGPATVVIWDNGDNKVVRTLLHVQNVWGRSFELEKENATKIFYQTFPNADDPLAYWDEE